MLIFPGVYILQMTHILFPGRADPAAKIFAIEGNPPPPNYSILLHFQVTLKSKSWKNNVKFCENSQSTNILPQIWLKVQFWRIYSPEN